VPKKKAAPRKKAAKKKTTKKVAKKATGPDTEAENPAPAEELPDEAAE